MKYFWFWFWVCCGPVWAGQCQPSSDPSFLCNSAEFQSCELTVDGVKRKYCLHKPNQGGPLPIVMMFHGAGGKARAMVNLLRTQTEQAMIFVIPEARKTERFGDCIPFWRQVGSEVTHWKDIDRKDSCDGGSFTDDLHFVSHLLDHFEENYEVQNTYAAGFSNGGDFVYQLYLTDPLARRFAGFAAVGAGLSGEKDQSLNSELEVDGFRINRDTVRPFLFQMGTEDKKNFPFEVFIETVESNKNCPPVQSARDALVCFYTGTQPKGIAQFDIATRRALTRNWLVDFNNASDLRHESLYPNLGNEQVGDETMTVREDYPKKKGKNSAHVTVLTTIDGGHEWPGWGGNYGPCGGNNCDIDLMVEILQFWHANGGMRTPLP